MFEEKAVYLPIVGIYLFLKIYVQRKPYFVTLTSLLEICGKERGIGKIGCCT